MSGFSAEWLGLRESADLRARSRPIIAATAQWTADRQPRDRPLRVVDLGAGTGSTLRAVSRHLCRPQAWTLIDRDRDLLAIADRQAKAMQRPVHLRAMVGDLADPAVVAAALGQVDLTTASALFDLVSEAWCRRLVRTMARRGGALYAALSYDGRIALLPDDPFDTIIRRLVNRHQRTDKGFGPALGPSAAWVLARLARASGARVCADTSDWHLGQRDRAMMALLLDGWAAAAREIEPENHRDIDGWLVRRRQALERDALRAIVGHVDLLATW